MSQQPFNRSEAAESSRRGFLKGAMAALGSVLGLALIWPLLTSLVGPALQRQARRYFKVGKLDQIPEGQPVRISFPYISVEGYIREQQTRDVWVIKHSASSVTVFSPSCTHLSCRYDWDPASRHFVCPCHGSVFALTGQVLAGPAPRPLDTLPFRIENGELLVEWETFRSGIPEKVSV